MPEVHQPSTCWLEFRMSLACLPAGANDQSVKVSLTTFMPGLASMTSMKPLWRSSSAGTPEMPRISTTLPFPPRLSTSHWAPRRPYSTWSLVTTYASGAVTAWSTATTTMSRAAASLMTGLSASRSAGLTMIALAPELIRLRIPAICALASPLTLCTSTSSTCPEASDWAFTEQIISSRQPLPTRVLLTPILYVFFSSDEPLPELALPPLSSSSPQPAATRANSPTRSARSANERARRLMGTVTLLLRWDMTNSSSGTLQHPCRAAGVLGVGRVEQTGRLLGAHHRSGREDRGHRPTLHQPRCGTNLHFVGERDRRDRRARTHGGVQAVERDEGVRRRRTKVEHHVGVIAQARSRRVGALPRLGRRERGDGDHGETTSPGADCHLDRHCAEPGRAEHHHRVGRVQVEVAQDGLTETLHALDEHRLALPVGAHDLRVERHRQLDDRMEARKGPVAREHLLDGDPGVPGAERVDEPAAADGVGAQAGRPLQLGILAGDVFEEIAHKVDIARGRHRHPATAAWSVAP